MGKNSCKNDLIIYCLKELNEQKIVLLEQVKRENGVPLTESFTKIINYVGEHPYLAVAAVGLSGALIYIYHDQIASYLIKLGSSVKKLIKMSSDHAKITEELVENHQRLTKQMDFVLKTIKDGKMGSDVETLNDLKDAYRNISVIAEGLKAITAISTDHTKKIEALRLAATYTQTLLEKSGIDPSDLIL